MSNPIIWSFGGGTQSVAIAVLVHQGKLPQPDRIVMADTGREATETWEYLSEVVEPFLNEIGLEVEVVTQEYATVGLWRDDKTLLPMYTPNGGRFPSYCSNEWKQRPIRRWLKERGYKAVRLWLGISVDEVHRAKPSGVQWVQNEWPLLDLRLRRDECRALVEAAGLPSPPRSSCWMCPHRSEAQWKRLRDEYPEDWEAALAIEAELQAGKDPDVFLHGSRKNLNEVDLNDDQQDLFGDCDGGYCFV